MVYCSGCGAEIHETALSCPQCGATTQAHASGQNRTVIAIVCFFFGIIGVHRFMVGKVGTGIAMLLTFGGFGIWTLIDFVMILTGKFTDKSGKVI